MKYLIILLFSITANAQSYFPIEKPSANTTYTDKAVCEKTEGIRCWEISKCDPVICKVGLVDDESRPLFRKENVVQCTDEVSCGIVLESHTCIFGQAFIDENFTEVYCAVPNGFEQIEGLVLDPVKVKEKEDLELARLEEERVKKEKEDERETELKACLNPGEKELADCVAILIREVLKDKLPVDDIKEKIK